MSSSPRRILIVFGTRPEAIKLFPLVHALRGDARFAARVCVTGQHRGMLDQVLSLAQIRPDHDLDVMQPGQTLDGLTAALVPAIGRVIDEEQPDWVVVQGDTTSALCAALGAYHRQISIAHVEAGLRSGSMAHPWPEEGNRKIIAALASLHCAPTARAADALMRENVDPAAVHVTGNTVVDALRWASDRMQTDRTLSQGLAGLTQRFAGKRLLAVTSHRRENFGSGMQAIAEAIRWIAAREDVAVIFPLHRNPQVRSTMEARLAGLDNVALVEPLDYPDFVRLLSMAELVLTDSGGIQEEAPALGKPVLVLRETTERPEGVEAGTARLVGADRERIVAETTRLLDDPAAYAAMARAHNPFGDGKSAQRIVELLARAS